MTRKAKQRRKQDPRDAYASMDRALNAALARRGNETPKDRQRAFGRTGKRPAVVLDVAGNGALCEGQ
jgi:hypothetical protein